MILALGHYANTGKSTAARILVENHGFTALSFAEPVYRIAYQTNASIRYQVDINGWEVVKRAHPAIRLHLVTLGDSLRRNLGPAVLIDALFDRMEPDGDYVVDDLRYPLEAQAIHDMEGVLVKATRAGVEPGSNTADQALADFVGWDAALENDGSIGDLEARIADLVSASGLRSMRLHHHAGA